MILNEFLLNNPDWNSQVNLRYAWQTSIKRGIQGNEKRSKLKSWPRRSISWQSQISTNFQRNLFLRKIFFNFQNIFGVPLWPYETYLTQAASIGNTTIYCNTVNLNFADDQIILITSDFINYDYGIIASFNDTSITLTEGLVENFILGAKVYPVLQCRNSNTSNINIDQITGKIAYTDVDFSEAYEEDQVYQPGSNGYPAYNGFYVFNTEPNWSSIQNINLTKPFEVLHNIGIDTSYSYQLETDFSLTYKYSFYSLENCRKIENFFNDMAGKYGNFWLPTWGNDFVITDEVINSDTILKIENINYLDNWLTNDLVGRIIFIKSDTSEVYRKIIAAPNEDEITLDSAVGIDISEQELKSIVSCFLLPVRFDIDELELNFTTNEILDVELKFYSQNNSDMIP